MLGEGGGVVNWVFMMPQNSFLWTQKFVKNLKSYMCVKAEEFDIEDWQIRQKIRYPD